MTIDAKHMGLAAGQIDGAVWLQQLTASITSVASEGPVDTVSGRPLTDDELRAQAEGAWQMNSPELDKTEYVAGYIEGFRQKDGTSAPRDYMS